MIDFHTIGIFFIIYYKFKLVFFPTINIYFLLVIDKHDRKKNNFLIDKLTIII